MKLRLTLIGLSLAFAATSGAAYAGTKELVAICSSARLTATERLDCRKQFKVAQTDTDRLSIFREFDNKMNGMNADGTRIVKSSLVQDAQAK